MDSVTQITLGAAVGEAVLGRSLGNKAIYWGAVFGTLPDMDALFTPLFDSVDFIVHHRGLSHSLFAVALLSPLLSGMFARWYRQTTSYRRWLGFFVLVFLTHILLDCCTSYGTQIFQPFSDRRVAWNIIFIIDPLYTVPFLACVVACLFLNRESLWRRRINALGLALSTSYLAAAFLIHEHVEQVFARAYEKQNIPVERFMVCPTAFNTILWYAVAEEETGYRIGYYSLFDDDEEIRFQRVPRQSELLGDLAESDAVNRLIWFADGYYAVREHELGVVLHILKFGKLNLLDEEELYPFSYHVYRSNRPVKVVPYEVPTAPRLSGLAARLWHRLRGEKASE